MIAKLRILFWNLVFWAKGRAGFRLLEPVEGVTGIVTAIEQSDDGDFSFDLAPDREWWHLLVYTTHASDGHALVSHACPSLHCEVIPRDHERLTVPLALLKVGSHVTVSGTRAWDGAHHERGILFDVLMVLLRANAVVDGWLEIHPVTELRVDP